MRAGKRAIIADTYALHIQKKGFISDNFREDQDFHISDETPKPFFAFSNRITLGQLHAKKLDLV